MNARRLALFALVAALAAPSSALAQEDDLLAPLTPKPTKPSRAKKPKSAKATKASKAPREPKKRVAKKPTRGSKGEARGKGRKPAPPPPDEDLLAPLTETGQLLVRAGGGVRGARLSVNGKDMGLLTSTPMVVDLPPGEHTLQVRRPGYAEYSRTLTLVARQTEELTIPLEPVVGFASLTADVPSAEVWVDGEPQGRAPMSGLMLRPGKRIVELRAPGFQPDIHEMVVVAGRNYEVVGKMRPLEVATSPVASVDAPRNPLLEPGRTPDSAPGLALNLGADSEVKQSASRPWYSRWYVWAGVGAVVAAGAVGTVVATQQDSAPSLADNPDRDVCGGNGCDAVIGASRPRGGGAGIVRLPGGVVRF